MFILFDIFLLCYLYFFLDFVKTFCIVDTSSFHNYRHVFHVSTHMKPHSTTYKNKSWIEETLEKHKSFLKCCPYLESRKLDC